ncbi:MAG: SH3 domain-containing protein [Alphaproteobacteria bacterium]|nr:SH3 domain-containing protein [Alphaproteobacteria bacterium]
MVFKNRTSFIFSVFLAVFLLFFAMVTGVRAAETDVKAKDPFHTTNLPLPRFASLGAEEVHVRAGPGQKYPIKWTFSRQGLPVEIILEFENWRKIRDHDGQEGWVYHTLLSGARTAFIESKENVPAYESPFNDDDKKSNINIMLEPKVLVNLEECQARWCAIEISGYHGWIERKFLWGIYENELFD